MLAHQLRRWPGCAGGARQALAAAAAAVGGGSMQGQHAAELLAPFGLPSLPTGSSAAHATRRYSREASNAAAAGGQLASQPDDDGGCGYGGDAAEQPFRRVQLVRDFIWDSLYHPREGYFSRPVSTGAGVVGTLPRPLDFPSFQGQTEYLVAVQALYRELQASWLTPVEIFQPHYGRAIAACVLGRWRALAADAAAAGAPEPPLLIHEIGGGTGTLAGNVLDWLREEHPAAYARCHYSCIEISPVLAAQQRRRVEEQGGHAGRFSVRRHDAADAGAWAAADAAAWEAAGGDAGTSGSVSGGGDSNRGGPEQQQQQHAFIILCEVLDNLPHDRVWRDVGSSEWQQTLVAELHAGHEHSSNGGGGGAGAYLELLQPATDPLIQRCLQALAEEEEEGGGGGAPNLKQGLALSAARAWRRILGEATDEVRWLPTGCLALLDTLQRARPSHTLIAADFDRLPEVAVAGINAPLVATTQGGATCDHGTYLVPRGTVDIFFPTDFPLICRLYRHAAAAAAAAGASPVVAAETLSTADFMLRHARDVRATATASGYNPLLEDYSNSAFFVGSCTRPKPALGGGRGSGSSSSSGGSRSGSAAPATDVS